MFVKLEYKHGGSSFSNYINIKDISTITVSISECGLYITLMNGGDLDFVINAKNPQLASITKEEAERFIAEIEAYSMMQKKPQFYVQQKEYDPNSALAKATKRLQGTQD